MKQAQRALPRRSARVLSLGPLPPPVGGMATVVANLSSELERFVEHRVVNSVKTTPVDRSLWQGVWAQLALIGRFWAACWFWRPTVVHIHTCSFFSFWRNGLDVLLARTAGCPVVLHVHGGFFAQFLGELGPWRSWLARFLLNRAGQVVVLGEVWRERLAPWVDAARFAVLPNAVVLPASVLDQASVPLSVLCLANYERGKGQDVLLRAFARLRFPPEVEGRLLLAGAPTEVGWREQLWDLVLELGLEQRVSIPGPLMGEAKVQAVAGCGVFCLPSYAEGLPMSVLEAMAAGQVVVATAVGSVPDVVQDGVNGCLVPPGDVDALVGRLQVLLDDADLRRALAQAARETVARDFALDRSVLRLFEIYRAAGARL